ncbi:hypothetical protein BGZ94_004093 [Podila epigama]|nr:hypothetical protein BGZ94_004093 [Podila epigama]
MRFSILAIASAAATTIMAAPISLFRRDVASNINILNFALGLEHLESAFYKEGLAKYGEYEFQQAGYDSKIWQRFVHIGAHENTHVEALTAVINTLKGHPVPPCHYKFPLNSVYDFIAIAQALETTGTSAYLGQAAGLDGDLLTAAASITTVEARHSAFLTELLGQNGLPYPFDTPLTAREVITIASNFIDWCPDNVQLEAPFRQLTATLPKAAGETKVETWFDGEKPDVKYWCQFLYNDKIVVSPREECALPPNARGYVYVVITRTSAPISLADDSTIVAGPALLFNNDHDSY